MKKNNWLIYALFIFIAEAQGAISGFITRGGVEEFENVKKSSLTPPSVVFPIVWSILFLLLGIGAARIAQSDCTNKKSALILFGIQLVLNFLWSPIFFNAKAYGFAFFWIILMFIAAIVMTLSFSRCDTVSAWLQVPYILWLIFAAYLNGVTWILNRGLIGS